MEVFEYLKVLVQKNNNNILTTYLAEMNNILGLSYLKIPKESS